MSKTLMRNVFFTPSVSWGKKTRTSQPAASSTSLYDIFGLSTAAGAAGASTGASWAWNGRSNIV